MAKLAQLPGFERAGGVEADARRVPRLRTRYYAFLSYSHRDKQLADWLHRELERFRVPSALAGKLTANGVVPRRLTPIFRDEQDLSAGGDLAEEIKAALAASQFLVVLCSPTAARSRWTNAEIESFKRTRPEGCVLAAVVAGEPFASDMPGREEEECFPPALRYKYDRRGHQTTKRAEPLAADFRAAGEGQRMAFLKLVAGMLGVGLDELVQREQTRRHRRMAWLAAASLGGMAVTSGLALTAIQARDAARDQRRQAEGLIGFMLGDLRDKLEPIGKLDALDGVGTRVLAYYHNQPIADLSDSALSQRSQALSLMADVATQRGNTDSALSLYREAMAGTAEAIRRKPDDPSRVFAHAQNIFYVGQIAYVRGQLDEAASRFTEYKQLADRMVALDPNNMAYRVEVQNALANLGAVRLAQRRFPESAALGEQALRAIEAVTTFDPNKRDYLESLTESLAWSADAERDAGHLDKAVALRERLVGLLTSLLSRTGDVTYRQRLIAAERKLGMLYALRGQLGPASDHMRAAVAQGEQLTSVEAGNRKWREYWAVANENLAYILTVSGKPNLAVPALDPACATIIQLLGKDPRSADLRKDMRECWMMRGYVAYSKGANADAATAAQEAIAVGQTLKSADSGADAFGLAMGYRLLGDAKKGMGDGPGAAAAWTKAFQSLPQVAAERPAETQEHAIILERLGRTAEAQQLRQRLAATGYRLPEVPRN
jgi:tetratricopeptide (TPR) repeat protein